MGYAIEPGDVLTRTGLVNVFGVGFNVLPTFISEPYNHSGVALNAFDVHHVESNGYETIAISNFFNCKNAGGGAIIRFVGPLANKIRPRVAEVAYRKRYPKLPGNPFSSSDNSNTVNCNEFVYSLFQIAIAELLSETHDKDPGTFAILAAAYSHKALIKSRQIRMKSPFGGNSIGGTFEFAGRTQAQHPDVKMQFEGKTNCALDAWLFCAVSEVVLETYTPNSFIESQYFTVVDRIGCTK